MKEKNVLQAFLVITFLLLIACSVILPILGLQGSGSILSYGTVSYPTESMEWGTSFVHYDDPNLGTSADAELAKSLGITVVRVHSYYQWPLSEPSSGSYDFHHQDRIVSNLVQVGLKVILETPQPTPEFTPVWAGDITTDPIGVIDAMVPFMDRLVNRYKGKVAYYQLGNEIDCPWERLAWLTDDVLVHYFNTMISTIKSIDRDAKTIINCVADAEPRITNLFNLLEARGVQYDIIGIQPGVFPEKYIPIFGGWDFTPETALRQNLDLVVPFGKPIWISETYMYPVAEVTGTDHTEEEEIDMLQRSVSVIKDYPEVTGYLWYPYEQMMYDPWYWYGLVDARASPTKKNTTNLYNSYKSIIDSNA